jgi:hypothetical protein
MGDQIGDRVVLRALVPVAHKLAAHHVGAEIGELQSQGGELLSAAPERQPAKTPRCCRGGTCGAPDRRGDQKQKGRNWVRQAA